MPAQNQERERGSERRGFYRQPQKTSAKGEEVMAARERKRIFNRGAERKRRMEDDWVGINPALMREGS